MEIPHILLVTFPAQGHINPALQLAKRLTRIGARITFATTTSAMRRMTKSPATEGLEYAALYDGFDNGIKPGDSIHNHMSEIRRCSSQSLKELIQAKIDGGCRFACVVHSILIPWVAVVARGFNLQTTFLWNQAATIMDIYYYYFNGYADVVDNSANDPLSFINLPGLPPLKNTDLPSFLNPSNTYLFALPGFKEEFEILDVETRPKILINTIDALEPEALKAIEKYEIVTVGPLIPSAFLDGKEPSDTSFGGDLFQSSKDYIQWLNSKAQSSVIYVSFGSLSEFSKPQMEEIARALVDTGRPFLWVIRTNVGEEEKEEFKLSCREEVEKQGMIVPWCTQVEVLSHPSIGCFLSHCGWNSTLESLVSGVPLVAFPQWSDQATNAKLIQDVWRTGVRVAVNKDGLLEADELKRCLEMVMSCEGRGDEMRRSAKIWKDLAREAANDGGSSANNLKAFMDEMRLKISEPKSH